MHKKLHYFLIMAVIVSMAIPVALAAPKTNSTRIKDGEITYSAGHYLEGERLTIGFDIFGYNYQAHLFKGSYANVYLGRDGLPPYTGDAEAYLAEHPEAAEKWYWSARDTNLVMKWNDAWLSNMDQDDDGALDLYYGYDSYIGSGAWLTNHMTGVNEDGTHWTYFTKIVAVPEDAVLDGDLWYTADGTEIGPEIWGAFATIMEVSNDPALDEHGVLYLSPFSAGFGAYAP